MLLIERVDRLLDLPISARPFLLFYVFLPKRADTRFHRAKERRKRPVRRPSSVVTGGLRRAALAR